jgi:pimeloyl-ACP methyl ester carboxylesterase
MPQLNANGLTFEYDVFGQSGNPAVLLIMGIGTQMIAWPESLCQGLADRGFYVIRYDNRDVGLSSRLEDHPVPTVEALMMAVAAGQVPQASYTLSDMAKDAVGVLDALGIAQAHVVGASMGGMITQVAAIEHPTRTKSMVSIMSSTGEPGLPQAQPHAMMALLTPPADASRAAAIQRTVDLFTTIGSPGYPAAPGELAAMGARSFDRGVYPPGFLRQLAAILATPPRTQGLNCVTVPAMVLHGVDDPLIPLGCGEHTAQCIPGAEMVAVPGMGHDFTQALTQAVYLPELIRFLEKAEGRA